MNKWRLLVLAITLVSAEPMATPQIQELPIAYLDLSNNSPTPLASWVIPPANSGLLGARLAIDDANTSGKFSQQKLTMTYHAETTTSNLIARLESLFALDVRIFLINAESAGLRQAQQWANDKAVLLVNVVNSDDKLRQRWCHRLTLHTAPSNSMTTDAIAQWLLKKRLNHVLVIHGQYERDLDTVAAFVRSAKRYGLTIIDTKQWDFSADLRRSAANEMSLFTQTGKEYDAVFVADTIKDFAHYLPYNTYLPRPVVGASGLEALSWHPRMEQWGALQLQHRFTALATRSMNNIDFQGYLAVRALSTAFFKSKSTAATGLLQQIQHPDFSFGGYLGRKLSFREWNGQLRMPISIVHSGALISQSPQSGILHPINDLDTLGFDQQLSQCNFAIK